MFKTVIKRTIYKANCPTCEWEETVDKNPPREKMCPNCRIWCSFVEFSWTGKDKFNE